MLEKPKTPIIIPSTVTRTKSNQENIGSNLITITERFNNIEDISFPLDDSIVLQKEEKEVMIKNNIDSNSKEVATNFFPTPLTIPSINQNKQIDSNIISTVIREIEGIKLSPPKNDGDTSTVQTRASHAIIVPVPSSQKFDDENFDQTPQNHSHKSLQEAKDGKNKDDSSSNKLIMSLIIISYLYNISINI